MTKAKTKGPNYRVMPEMVREEPPIPVRYDWPRVADHLRKDPMTWWKVFEQGRVAVVNAIKQGKVADVHPDLGFEVRTAKHRREAPRLCDLYMRFNPERESDLRAAVRAAKKGK